MQYFSLCYSKPSTICVGDEKSKMGNSKALQLAPRYSESMELLKLQIAAERINGESPCNLLDFVYGPNRRCSSNKILKCRTVDWACRYPDGKLRYVMEASDHNIQHTSISLQQ
jgi:hypothetical protein